MAEKEEARADEKANVLIAKQIGYLPEEITAMGALLKATRDILNFYLNEFGLHLGKEQQEELGKLSNKSDLLVLKTARLSFEMKSLECSAKKSIETKKPFEPDKKMAKELAAEIRETKESLLELNKRIAKIVEQMKETKREE